MRMPKHTLKLLVLLAVAAVAPASAAHVTPVTADYDSGCPYERAALAAAGYETMAVSTEGDPAEGSLFDPGRRSSFLSP